MNESLHSKAFKSALTGTDLTVKSLTNAPSEFNNTLLNLAYCPVAYLPEMIRYQIKYWGEKERSIADYSLIFYHENVPCGIWPISIMIKNNGRTFIGSNGGSLLPPLFIHGLPERTIKNLSKKSIFFLKKLSQILDVDQIIVTEPFLGKIGVTEWFGTILQHSSNFSNDYYSYLSMDRPLLAIKSGFRKSYKPLISEANKLWIVEAYEKVSLKVWSEFKELHYIVAGRATRSSVSWDIQFDSINVGCAFLIVLRDDFGSMVGGGLFYTTKQEGLYAVGAYKRELFDKPLGHLVQSAAIEVMHKKNISWYHIGKSNYEHEIPIPSPKEMNISLFKQGFRSHLVPQNNVIFFP